jgi:CheY-like chemotaxis protein
MEVKVPPLPEVRVLVIDDEPPVLKALLAQLKLVYPKEHPDQGIILHGVTSADKADEWLKANRADVVVTDGDMPGRSGIAFAKSHSGDFGIIVVSGKPRAGFFAEAKDLRPQPPFFEKTIIGEKTIAICGHIREFFASQYQAELLLQADVAAETSPATNPAPAVQKPAQPVVLTGTFRGAVLVVRLDLGPVNLNSPITPATTAMDFAYLQRYFSPFQQAATANQGGLVMAWGQILAAAFKDGDETGLRQALLTLKAFRSTMKVNLPTIEPLAHFAAGLACGPFQTGAYGQHFAATLALAGRVPDLALQVAMAATPGRLAVVAQTLTADQSDTIDTLFNAGKSEIDTVLPQHRTVVLTERVIT